MTMTKKELKKKLQEKLDKKKKGLIGKKDGGFQSLNSTGVGASTSSNEGGSLGEDNITESRDGDSPYSKQELKELSQVLSYIRKNGFRRARIGFYKGDEHQPFVETIDDDEGDKLDDLIWDMKQKLQPKLKRVDILPRPNQIDRSKLSLDFSRRSDGPGKTNLMLREELITEAKISSKTMKKIEQLRKKKLDDDEIMIELDKKLNLKQKEMNEVARFLLKIDK